MTEFHCRASNRDLDPRNVMLRFPSSKAPSAPYPLQNSSVLLSSILVYLETTKACGEDSVGNITELTAQGQKGAGPLLVSVPISPAAEKDAFRGRGFSLPLATIKLSNFRWNRLPVANPVHNSGSIHRRIILSEAQPEDVDMQGSKERQPKTLSNASPPA